MFFQGEIRKLNMGKLFLPICLLNTNQVTLQAFTNKSITKNSCKRQKCTLMFGHTYSKLILNIVWFIKLKFGDAVIKTQA